MVKPKNHPTLTPVENSTPTQHRQQPPSARHETSSRTGPHVAEGICRPAGKRRGRRRAGRPDTEPRWCCAARARIPNRQSSRTTRLDDAWTKLFARTCGPPPPRRGPDTQPITAQPRTHGTPPAARPGNHPRPHPSLNPRTRSRRPPPAHRWIEVELSPIEKPKFGEAQVRLSHPADAGCAFGPRRRGHGGSAATVSPWRMDAWSNRISSCAPTGKGTCGPGAA